MMSTRTFESEVKGPYSLASSAVSAKRVPKVKSPEITSDPPKP